MVANIHTCKSCGKVAGDTGHLCDPVELKQAHVCDDCGQASTNPRHICKPKLRNVNFACVACGRVAEIPSKLCNPRDIEAMAKGDPRRNPCFRETWKGSIILALTRSSGGYLSGPLAYRYIPTGIKMLMASRAYKLNPNPL